ncbi:MAG: cyclic pyranopterin monophosphate synthase MoaC [Anaerolineales bacterium]|nr:cyclic pyranopterin monophosphate synthase MoaC [Anaerolineales bacterium]
MELTHLDERGSALMVDVGDKPDTARQAIAKGRVCMRPETLALIAEGGMPKGDTLAVARVAGIMAAKQTASIIPLCHTLLLTQVRVDFELISDGEPALVEIQAEVHTTGKTGAEMEALAAVSIAALTIYDMCKAVDRGMRITDVCLVSKSGGKSGDWNFEKADNGPFY